jgi:hypothetical protein
MEQYRLYTDGTYIYRDGVRSGKFVIDKELTPLGFSGSESIDEGVSGDWMNLKEYS